MFDRLRRVALALACLALLAPVVAEPAAAAPPAIKKKPEKKPTKKTPTAPTVAVGPKPIAPPPPARKPIELGLEVKRVTLGNGLRVVLNPVHGSPTVAIAVTYDVGSRDDEAGKTGFAHLYEHLMFAGSKNVDKGEHAERIYAHGGVVDATTDVDRTNYYDLLPANEIELALWLEADRMKALVVTVESFENQRKVVEEEYRMRVTNVPYRLSTLKLEALVYQGYPPYERAIQTMSDLENAKFESIAAFHAQHYGPNTAVLSIAGDFAVDDVMPLVEKYFGAIPKIEARPFTDAPFPEQVSQRSTTVRDVHARSSMVQYGWPIPRSHAPDHDALEIAAVILAGGDSSRLHQVLVRDKALAQSVRGGARGRRGPDLFTIEVRLADGAKVLDVEKLVEAELKSLASKPPSAEELAKAKRIVETTNVLALQSNYARATRLGEMELFFGDATLLNHEPARTFAVTSDDVKRVSEKYLGPLKRTLVETLPPEGESVAKPAPKPAPAATTSKPAPATPAKKTSDKDKKATDKKLPKKGKP